MNKINVISFLSILTLILIINEVRKLFSQNDYNKIVDSNKIVDNNIEVKKKKLKFINYNTTWCYWSKKIQPVWDKLKKLNENNENIEILDIKCDLKDNEKLCNENEIEGFPTLKLYTDDDQVIDYQGDRSLDDLVKFLEANSH
tara:strand:- start:1822 stop:2250 length:429 start_codon:yes stop_codon:yes gene_type:complete